MATVFALAIQPSGRIWLGGTGRTIDLMLYGILILLVCMWRPSGILSLVEERIRRRAAMP